MMQPKAHTTSKPASRGAQTLVSTSMATSKTSALPATKATACAATQTHMDGQGQILNVRVLYYVLINRNEYYRRLSAPGPSSARSHIPLFILSGRSRSLSLGRLPGSLLSIPLRLPNAHTPTPVARVRTWDLTPPVSSSGWPTPRSQSGSLLPKAASARHCALFAPSIICQA